MRELQTYLHEHLEINVELAAVVGDELDVLLEVLERGVVAAVHLGLHVAQSHLVLDHLRVPRRDPVRHLQRVREGYETVWEKGKMKVKS